jgi:NAD(P)-dependent dehydrogenase (short-subunit alcohol dehydrogenase family)
VQKGRAVAGFAGRFEVRRLDVSDLGSVREFAAGWDGPLHVLINNAGVMDVPAARTADGFDLQTATNYTGPFVLTNLLLPHVGDRIVSVTSRYTRNHPDGRAERSAFRSRSIWVSRRSSRADLVRRAVRCAFARVVRPASSSPARA